MLSLVYNSRANTIQYHLELVPIAGLIEQVETLFYGGSLEKIEFFFCLSELMCLEGLRCTCH